MKLLGAVLLFLYVIPAFSQHVPLTKENFPDDKAGFKRALKEKRNGDLQSNSRGETIEPSY